MRCKLVVAYSLPTYSIGLDGTIPWRYPEDLLHFRNLTLGHTVIMGRRTWESLPLKPLPGRFNIVLSSSAIIPGMPRDDNDFEWLPSLQDALAVGSPNAYIIGGASLYTQALQQQGLVEEVVATEIRRHHPGDTFFPHHLITHWPKTLLRSTPDFDIVSYKGPTP